MTIDLTPLDKASRLLIEAELKVATGGGGRFQPTGFPDLGPALYKGADGNDWLLVESPQSMANRMERVCWIDGDSERDRVGNYNDDCRHIPYVMSEDADGRPLTASPLEAHRLSSPYIWNTQPFSQPDSHVESGSGQQVTLPAYIKKLFKVGENRLVPWKQVALGLLKVDPACLLHGIWFSDPDFAGGKVRITRSLSGYIEASAPAPANFGFQKRDMVSDRTDKESGQSAVEGYGSVIGPKQQFTSPKIKAYFHIDLERLRSYGLSNEQLHALAAWAIYKIRRVLAGSRDGVGDLRTECKFEVALRESTGDSLAAQRADQGAPSMEESIDAWLINAETGQKQNYSLPSIDDDLKAEFKSLEAENPTFAPMKVKWIPKIEGKAEIPDNIENKQIKRKGLESKSRFDEKRSKAFFAIFGEWSQSDKKSLLDQNPDDPTKTIVQKAIKDYEKKWETKAQSRKTLGDNDRYDEGDGGIQ